MYQSRKPPPKEFTFMQWLKKLRNKKEVIDSRSLPGTLHFLRGATSGMACAPGAQGLELKVIRAARQVWVVDMDDATPQQEAHWTTKKLIVPERDIVCLISSVLIGRDTLLRDNPICFPVQNAERK
jgi:hypothetical protein